MAVYGALISVVEQTPAMLVGTIDESTLTAPSTRPDGSTLQDGDYLKVKPGAVVPFTITAGGQTFTIESVNDTMSYSRTEGKWYLNASDDTKTDHLIAVNKASESISGNSDTQQKINIEFVNRCLEVLKEAKFEVSDDKLKLVLTEYKNTDLLNEELDIDKRGTQNSKNLINSDAVWEEIINKDNSNFEYDTTTKKVKLKLVNNAGEELFNKEFAVTDEATENNENLIISHGVWKELIKVSDDKLEIVSHVLTLEFKNNKGEVLFSKTLNIDENATENSHNLIDSEAVWKKQIKVADSKFIVEDDKLKLLIVANDNTNLLSKDIEIDTTATENSHKIIISHAVWKEIINNANSSFELKEDTNEDYIELVLKNNNSEEKFNNTIHFNDFLVLQHKEQELYKKTLDFNTTLANKNIAKNIPIEALAEQTSADVNKVLQVDNTNRIALQFIDVIKQVSALPLTKPDEDIIYQLTTDGKLYYWDETKNTTTKIGGGGVKRVEALPTSDIDEEYVYLLETTDAGKTTQELCIYNKNLSKWYKFRTDAYGEIAYEENEITLKNKTIKAEENKLSILISVDALPTADIQDDIFYYLTTNKQIYSHKTGEWQLLGDKAIEIVEVLPTSDIHTDHFYSVVKSIYTLRGRYSSTKTEYAVDKVGIQIDTIKHAWAEVEDAWGTANSFYPKYIDDNENGNIYRYYNSSTKKSFLQLGAVEDDTGLFYYYDSTWHKVFAPETDFGEVVYTKKEQTLTNKTISGEDNTLEKIPLSSLAEQTSADVKKVLQVGSDNKIGLSFLDIIEEVDTLPLTKIDEDVFLAYEDKLYYWSETQGAYVVVSGTASAVIRATEMPTDPDKDVFYAISDADNEWVLKVYSNDTKQWVDIYDSKNEVVYRTKEQTLTNKTISAENNKLTIYKDVYQLPSDASTAEACIYYQEKDKNFYISNGSTWLLTTGAIITTDTLPVGGDNGRYIYNYVGVYTSAKYYRVSDTWKGTIDKVDSEGLWFPGATTVSLTWDKLNEGTNWDFYYGKGAFTETDTNFVIAYCTKSDGTKLARYATAKLSVSGLKYYDTNESKYKVIGGDSSNIEGDGTTIIKNGDKLAVNVDSKSIKYDTTAGKVALNADGTTIKYDATAGYVVANIDNDTIKYDTTTEKIRTHKVFYTSDDTEPTDAVDGDIWLSASKSTSSYCPIEVGGYVFSSVALDLSVKYPNTTWQLMSGEYSVWITNDSSKVGQSLTPLLPSLPAVSVSCGSAGAHTHSYSYNTSHKQGFDSGSTWGVNPAINSSTTGSAGAHTHSMSASYASSSVYTGSVARPTSIGMYCYLRLS